MNRGARSGRDERLGQLQVKIEDNLIGRVLEGRYRLESVLGKGGMGAVYRAKQLSVDRDVAIKVLIPSVSTDDRLVARFENEAKIIARLQHPHTLKLIELGRMDDGRLFLVTEYLHGETLQDRLRRSGSIEIPLLLAMLRQLAESLIEAHALGIVHRDLKPGNLFLQRVGDQDILKVLDFGIAKLGHQSQMTATGAVFGTPAYMAPEQARGDKVDARADLYSIGIIAYECLVGRPPFEGDSMPSVLIKHIMDPVPPLDSYPRGAEIPAPLKALVMRLLAKSPADRPASAAALRAALDELLDSPGPRFGALTLSAPLEEPLGALAGPTPASSVRSRSTGLRGRQHEAVFLGIVAALLVICGAMWAAWSVGRNSQERPPVALAPVEDPPAALADAGAQHAGAAVAALDAGPSPEPTPSPTPQAKALAQPVKVRGPRTTLAPVATARPTPTPEPPRQSSSPSPSPTPAPSSRPQIVPPGLIPVDLGGTP